MQPIEGITPDALWTTIGVLLGLCAIVVLVYKVIEIARKEHERKEKKATLTGQNVTDEIADKVLAKLAPRLDKIDQKLAKDKERLDSHELRLNDQEKGLQRLSKDTAQIMDVLDAMLMHFITGNGQDHLRAVKDNLDRYKNSR